MNEDKRFLFLALKPENESIKVYVWAAYYKPLGVHLADSFIHVIKWKT